LTLVGDVCENARIVLGGVAPRPWRALGAEAEPMSDNGYKIDLGKAIVRRAVLLSAASVR